MTTTTMMSHVQATFGHPGPGHVPTHCLTHCEEGMHRLAADAHVDRGSFGGLHHTPAPVPPLAAAKPVENVS